MITEICSCGSTKVETSKKQGRVQQKQRTKEQQHQEQRVEVENGNEELPMTPGEEEDNLQIQLHTREKNGKRNIDFFDLMEKIMHHTL